MSPARILIVDDNPANLKLTGDLLEFEGYTVLRCATGEEALDIVPQTPPDLILMDINLPGMDGLTVTKILKANEKTKPIIIIALTAYAMKGDENKMITAGCDGYISKPVDTRQLPHQIIEFLKKTPS